MDPRISDMTAPVGLEGYSNPLHIIDEPRKDHRLTVDIVAVHGMGGHPQDSWTSSPEAHGECTWLKREFPCGVVGSRTTSFTHDASTKGVAALLSEQEITRAAECLLRSLTKMRAVTNSQQLPIAFMAHDFGGFIIKKALIMAESNDAFSEISKCCYQLVFFATPHRASITSTWEDLLMNIFVNYHIESSAVFIPDIRKKINTLSKFVAHLSVSSFPMIVQRCVLNVYQYCGGISATDLVVDTYCATTGLIHEISVARDSRHQDLCKFEADNPAIPIILEVLRLGIKAEHRRCLTKLFNISPPFVGPEDERGFYSLGAHDESALPQEYNAWLESAKPCIVTSCGPSGSGKGHYARVLFRILRTRTIPSIYFSFSQNDHRRASLAGLLGSVALQLLVKGLPESHFVTERLYSVISNASIGTQESLLAMFRYLLERSREHSPIHLVVEGLHRCDTSWKELVGMLTEAFGDDSLHGKLKVALFYRERADISEALAEVENFRFKGPDLDGSPAKRPLGPLVSRVISDSPTLSIIQPVLSDTLTRCKDVTEMSLTIKSVRDGNGPRRTFKSMTLLLKDLPPSIADTVLICFKRLLSWGRIALGWVTHAKRPLSLNEIAVAVALTERQDTFNRGFDPQDFPIDSAAEVQYSFGSLLIIDNGYVTFGNDEVKQCFLNCLANEKQMQSEGADQVETEEKMEVAVPDETQITRVLLGYISLPELLGLTRLLEQNSNPDSPHGLHLNLARYAVQFWPIHYRAAARVQPEDESVSKMLRHIDCGNLSRLYTDLNPAALPPGILINNLFLLAAQLGFTNVIKAQDLHAEGEHGSTAIELASWNGHVETVKHLLRSCPLQRSSDLGQSCTHATIRGYISVVELLLEHQKQTGNLSTLELEKLLGLAAQLGYKDQINLFSVYGADIDSSIEGVTPLQHAAENGYTSIAKYLLAEKNADVDAKSGTAKDPPIMLAASNGHLGVVRLLVAAGADMATETNDHRTPLYVASKNGHESTVRCLLHHARDKGGTSERRIIDFRGPGGKTPLVAACSGKHAGTAHSLLENGADAAISDDDTFSAAYYAICHGYSVLAEKILENLDTKNPIQGCGEMFVHAAEHGLVKVMHILMDPPMASNGIKLWNIEGGEGRTALHYAAQGGWIEIVHMLLKAGADVNKEDRNGSAPLELAAVAGEVETIKSLLRHGATAVKALAESETILVRVAKSKPHKSHGEVVKILLDEAVDPNTKSSEEMPLLNVAVAAGNHGVVKTLLESPVDTKMKNKWEWSPLHEAANWYRGSVKTSRLLVEAGIDPLGVDVDGWLPAHLAARSGNIQLLNFLTELHPKCLNATDVDGLTPLHLAASNNEPEALTWLLENSVEINAQDNNNETAIMKAAASGCDASVRILMAARADLSLRNKDGKTPLHYAARAGEIEIGRFILQSMSDILCWRDDNNYSALHEAIVNSEPEFAEMLLDEFYGTDDTGSLKDLSAAAKPNGRTPLISAVYGNQNQVVRRLLERKAEVEMRDSQNMSALRAAVDRDSGEIIDLLLDSSLTKFADINAGGGAQPTALHEAARKGNKVLVSRLIYLGARVNGGGGQHNTALSAAAFSGYDEIVELLLQNGADASLHGGNLPNALGAAIYSETYELVESLINAGADVNAKDNQGRTSVHLAARRGSWRILHNLISEHGGDSSLTDTQGRKVIHHAAMSGDVELVAILLDDEPDHSLDLDLPDYDGWTPLHHACRNVVNFQVVEALVAGGADLLKTTKDGWTAESIAVFHDAGDIANYIREQCENMKKLPLAQNWKIGEPCTASCDGCLLWPMIGMRWRCQDCQDFDFCFKCYWTAEQTHPDHKFISIPETGGIPSRGPEVIQEEDSECRSEGSVTQSTDSGRRSDA